ncbi:hypothetical protein ACFY78_36670 [Streptomyces olindensis]|uniref:hypothetical protein n=1 Tax=Streptomyces olindensis TaxID=358823 RepID=UPI0036A4343A
MNRLSVPLYAAYGALFAWLAYCAVQSARNGALWACAVFAVGSGVVVIAYFREDQLEAALHREAERADDTRPTDSSPRDAIDAVAAVAMAGACCEVWWATAGAQHEPGCRRSAQRSAA